jgi:hypothetical protein
VKNNEKEQKTVVSILPSKYKREKNYVLFNNQKDSTKTILKQIFSFLSNYFFFMIVKTSKERRD